MRDSYAASDAHGIIYGSSLREDLGKPWFSVKTRVSDFPLNQFIDLGILGLLIFLDVDRLAFLSAAPGVMDRFGKHTFSTPSHKADYALKHCPKENTWRSASQHWQTARQ